MSLTVLEKTTLCLSGLTVLGIGGVIMTAPQVFYASYGIVVGDDPSLLSELRALAAALITLGALMLVGVLRAAMAQFAVAASFIVFLAFPAGRLIGVMVDGIPSAGIIGALLLEIAIASLCIFAFRRRIIRAISGAREGQAHN